MFGLLNLHKPSGKTSRWVVDQIQRVVKPAKVGHAGTLDPLASGVLVVALGRATRLIDFVQQMPKRYRAEFRLGYTSPTEDIDGTVSPLVNPQLPDRAEIEAAIPRFLGQIMQMPPAYSALKISGRRAYDLARKGETLEMKPRPVTIHQLHVARYEYPLLTLEIQCSRGTYVRSLGRDLAAHLGTGAVMSALKRTAIGCFDLANSVDVFQITRENFSQYLLTPQTALECLPSITVATAETKQLQRGQPIPSIGRTGDHAEFAALDECGNLVAILCRHADGSLWPSRNFMGS